MAGEIQAPYGVSGRTLYALVRNSVGQVWQVTTSTFVAYVTANLVNYVVTLAEQGTASGFYAGDFPAAPAGAYGVVVRERAGGAVAESDAVVAAGEVQWGGSAVLPRSGLPAAQLDLADAIEAGVTERQALRLVLAATAGKSSGATAGAGGTLAFRNAVADSKARVTAVCDSAGNRVSVTWDSS